MMDFYSHLMKRIVYSIENNFDPAPLNFLLFGKVDTAKKNAGMADAIYKSKAVTSRFINKSNFNAVMKNLFNTMDKLNLDFSGLNFTYQKLQDQQSKDLLVDIFAYKLLGPQKILLPTNTPAYIKGIEKCKEMEKKNLDKVFPFKQPHANQQAYDLHYFDLNDLGFDIKIFQPWLGTLTDFIMEQYTYKSPNKTITIDDGDVCIDAGGCWGDSALYFALKAGKTGKVYSFEFIDSNMAILNYNLSLNPHLKNNIELVPNPIFDEDNIKMYYIDDGPASRIDFEPLGSDNSVVKTKTIDTLIKEKNLSKVDFIKMDIEGVELRALKGSVETIKKFKPKLAIAVYHKNVDFYEIPQFIDSLNLGYKFYLGHYTVFAYETIIYGIVE